MPIDKGTTLPITQLSGLQINYKDSNSCFNLPIMNNAERKALINTNDPANPIKNGTMIFNSDDNLVQYYQIKDGKGAWISVAKGAGTGDVVGPSSSVTGNLASFSDDTGKEIKDSGISTDLVVSASSASVQKNQIPVWYTTTKGKITLSNSGVNISKIQSINARKNVNESELYLLSNLGALQFGNSENVADTGVILLDGLTPVTFQMQGTGANSRVCTVINGEIGEGSSSPSAILEINSTVGALLNARLNIAQRDALVSPQDGMLIFNTESKTLESRQNGEWITLGTGNGDGTVTAVGLINNDNNLTITGSPITEAGDIEVNLKPQVTIEAITLNNPNNYGYTLSSPASLAQNLTLTLPKDNGTAGQILSTDGQGNTNWVNDIAGGTVTSVGLTNTDSNLTITGSPITQAGNIEVDLKSQIVLKTVTLNNTSGYGYTLSSPVGLGSSINFTLPTSSGIKGQILSTDGQGNTNWVNDIAGGTVTSVGLTNTDSNLTITGGPITQAGNIEVDLKPQIALKTITLNNLNNYGYTLASPAGLNSNKSFVLPATSGKSGQILSTDGQGNTNWVDDIAGGTVTSVNLTNTDSNLTITGGPITQAGNIEVDLKPQIALKTITLNNLNNYGYTLASPTGLANNLNFVLPNNSGKSGQILSTDGQGNTSWVNDIAGGTVTSVNLTNTDSNLTITGGPVTQAGNIEVNLNSVLNGITSVNLANSGKTISLSAPLGLSNNLTFVLPGTNGTAGQILSTDGKGNTSWVNDIAGGTVTSVNLTNTDSNLTITGGPVTQAGNIEVNLNSVLNGITSVNLANSGKTISLSAPLGLSNNLTFVLPGTNGTAGQILSTDGKGNTSWVNDIAGGTVTSVGLTNTDSNLTITGGPITQAGNIAVNLKPQLAIKSVTLNNTNNYGYTLSSPNGLGSNLNFTLPTGSGIKGQILSTDGQGNTSWVNDIAGGTVTSVGLTNTDSNLTITGSPVTSSGSISVNLNKNLNNINILNLSNNNNKAISLSASSALSSNLNFVLPSTIGTSGQILSTDGQGNTSWVNNTGGGGTVTSVGLTNTDSNLTITGGPVTSSGNIAVNLNKKLSITTLFVSNNIDADLVVTNTFSTGSVTLRPTQSDTNLSIQAPSSLPSTYTFTLPTSMGTAGQVLSTDGKNSTSWASRALTTSSYLLTQADASLPNATILPVINTGVYSSSTQNSGNLYLGTNTGNKNTGPTNNLGLGYQALNAISYNSIRNIAIGYQALQSAQNITDNTAIGYLSMSAFTSTAAGFASNFNTAVGSQTFLKLTSASTSGGFVTQYNTALGYNAGSTQQLYQNCTFIGANADATTSLTNATAIGYGAKVSKSNALVLGNSSTYVGLGGIASPNYSLHIGNINNTAAILLSATSTTPSPPSGANDIALFAKKGEDYGALYMRNSDGSIYKYYSIDVSEPASAPTIPVLTAEEIQNLQEIALGAIVYDSTNDTVIISTKSGWQNLTRSLYNPQNSSTVI